MLKKLFIISMMSIICFFAINGQALAETEKKDETVDEWLKDDSVSEHDSPAVDEVPPAGSSNENLAFVFVKMLAALAFIVFLIYALAKFVNKRTKTFGGNRAIETIGGVSVGSNRSIQLVKVGNRLLVIGVGESIHLLKELTDKNEIEALLQEHEGNFGYEDFFSKSKQWLENRKSSNRQNFTSILEQQLNRMSENRKNAYKEFNKKESGNE